LVRNALKLNQLLYKWARSSWTKTINVKWRKLSYRWPVLSNADSTEIV